MASANPDAKVGPNAVTQVAAALRAVGGDHLAHSVFEAADLGAILVTPPDRAIALKV